MEYIDGVYKEVARSVHEGNSQSQEDAFQLLNVIKRRTFRTYRPIAEARLLDITAFKRLLSTHLNPTLHDANSEARKILQRAANKSKLRDLYLAGVILRPARS